MERGHITFLLLNASAIRLNQMDVQTKYSIGLDSLILEYFAVRRWFTCGIFLLVLHLIPVYGTSEDACDVCSCKPLAHGTWSVECLDQTLESIPNGIPVKPTNLLLSKTRLCKLKTNAFNGLRMLENLTADNVGGCSAELFLRKGSLRDQHNLKRLRLTFDDPPICETHFPNEALSEIKQLQYLEINQIYLPLPNSTTNMYLNLRHLRIKSKWCFKYFKRYMFENIPCLRSVDFIFEKDEANISNQIFSNKNLETLQEVVLLSTPKRLLKELFTSIQRTRALRSLTVGHLLGSKEFKHLNFTSYIADISLLRSTNIESMSFPYIHIERFNFLELLPRSLHSLTFQANCFEFQAIYSVNWVLLPKLKQLSMTYQFSVCQESTYQRYALRNTTLESSRLSTLIYTSERIISNFEFFKSARLQNVTHLKYSNLHCSLTIDGNLLESMPLLEYADFSNNARIIFTNHSGFGPDIATITLENSLISCKGCESPSDLVLNVNSVVTFKNCSNLRRLKLANTGLQSLSTDFLMPNQKLELLNLSNNRLEQFQSTLSHLLHLKYVDLSFNRIRFITPDVIHDLGILSKMSKVHVDLRGNALTCSCELLTLLEVIQSSNVIFDYKESYTCQFSNGTKLSFENVDYWLPLLQQECKSYIGLIIGTTVAIVVFLGALTTAICYRYRWKLRYMFYRLKLSIPNNTIGKHYQRVFDYDAFISCADEDRRLVHRELIEELETKKGMRLCIHQRDFVAGDSVAENIARAVHNSRRTVVLMSKNFLASNWCMYEMNIARMEDIHDDRKVVIVVLLEDIPSSTLPFDVLDLIRTKTYLEYPPSREDEVHFWEKLAHNIEEE